MQRPDIIMVDITKIVSYPYNIDDNDNNNNNNAILFHGWPNQNKNTIIVAVVVVKYLHVACRNDIIIIIITL